VARVTKRLAVLAVVAAVALGLAPAPAQAAGKSFTFTGRGWGHGIGMSQWGAKGFADMGHAASWILAWFYQKTSLGKLSNPTNIRVGLLQEQSQITVTGAGPFEFYDSAGKLRANAANGQTWTVRPSGTQLSVLNQNGSSVFVSAPPVTVRWESHHTLLQLPQTGRQYKHGYINVDTNSSTGKVRAVLTIPFEQYLYGLGEMPASWPMEALKAQAIAARTYALEKITRLGQNRSVCNCGVYASTADQAYVGASQEVTNWVAAVDNTRSLEVLYGGKAIQAYYSASDGGIAENNENVFGGDPLPYLRARCDPGDFDKGANPQANWAVTYDGDQLAQRFQGGGFNTGQVSSVAFPGPRGISGRLLKVIDSTHGGATATGASGTARMHGYQFQSLLGLKSTLVLHNITGSIRLRYDQLNCTPGTPSSEAYQWHDLNGALRGAAQDFVGGRLFVSSQTKIVHWVKPQILAKYDDLRRHGTDFGLPTSDEYAITGGRRSDFERGYITLVNGVATAVPR